jgi:hypothetical protein
MKPSRILPPLALLLCAVSFAFQASPRISTVEPDTGKSGIAANAKGDHLGKSSVGELFLTDGKNDFKAVITEQTDAEIKFTVPKAAAGRYRLMILTANKASMIEQPVVFEVE